MEMEIPAREALENKMDLQLQGQQGHHYISRLLYELKIQNLAQVIQ